LVQLKDYAESIHNTIVLIKTLALLTLLHTAEEDELTALTTLEEVLQLAQPGGFVRLFVDLGSPMIHLLHLLLGKGVYSDYILKILAAFEADRRQPTEDDRSPLSTAGGQLEPLTHREMEVLGLLARRLTNKEIAEDLVVSVGTVKTHTLSIYAKLDVHSRRQAVKKAREFGLLPPS
jgi:LuxR family maltose regulon positive regulatory protein